MRKIGLTLLFSLLAASPALAEDAFEKSQQLSKEQLGAAVYDSRELRRIQKENAKRAANKNWTARKVNQQVTRRRSKQQDTSKGVLSLVVSIADREALESALANMRELRDKRKVEIGQLMIVGYRGLKTEEMIKGTEKTFKNFKGYPKSAKEWEEMRREARKRRGNQAEKIAKLPPETQQLIADVKGKDKEKQIAAFKKLYKMPYTSKLWTEQKLSNLGTVSSHRILERLKVKSSPTWVVHYGGADHVFEGLKTLVSSLMDLGTSSQ